MKIMLLKGLNHNVPGNGLMLGIVICIETNIDYFFMGLLGQVGEVQVRFHKVDHPVQNRGFHLFIVKSGEKKKLLQTLRGTRGQESDKKVETNDLPNAGGGFCKSDEPGTVPLASNHIVPEENAHKPQDKHHNDKRQDARKRVRERGGNGGVIISKVFFLSSKQ
jgi:hypothetical protein